MRYGRRGLSDDATLEDIERAALWELDEYVERQNARVRTDRRKREEATWDKWSLVVLALTPTLGALLFAWTAPHAELATLVLAAGVISIAAMVLRCYRLDESGKRSWFDSIGATVTLALVLGLLGFGAVIGGGMAIRGVMTSLMGLLP